MADINPIEAATRRLRLALDTLDAAVERRSESDRESHALSAQVHTLDNDRARLAAELDAAAARGRALETVNREVARRIDVAVESISAVLDAKGG